MEETQATQASHSVGAARTLLDLALDYYESCVLLEALDEAAEGFCYETTDELSLDECDDRLQALKDFAVAIGYGTSNEDDDADAPDENEEVEL